MNALVRGVLADALQRDPQVYLLGEAVDLSPATAGLRASNPQRVLCLPASDAALIGVAVGMALAGARPVVELADGAATWGALQQLGQEAASFSRDADFPVGLVVRVPVAPGGADPTALLAGVPGVQVVCASSGADAAALLRAALGARVPVVLIEPLGLPTGEPGDGGLGTGRIVRSGTAASVLTWGRGVAAALQAASAADAPDLEVVDLRSLSPLDAALIGDSVSRTGRPIVAGDAPGPVLAALQHAFLRLESPPVLVSPDAGAILAAARASLNY